MSEEIQDFDPQEEEIMEATYQALVKCGYSGLTVQAISDEFDKSKSLMYYHYEDKDDLLADFLEHAIRRFRRNMELQADEPKAQLDELVDRLVPSKLKDDSYQFRIALLELQSEAPHDEQVREQYTRINRTLRDVIARIVRRGIDRGVFADVDPEVEAEILVSLLFGIRARRLTTDENLRGTDARNAIKTHLDRLNANEEE